ncbi:MAG TPA: helix-turn-helix domain-containing protein [Mycobacteriales bacterium]|nr:helix-turn-helix domain-containing protein [Mycobacteriales bacterium]
MLASLAPLVSAPGPADRTTELTEVVVLGPGDDPAESPGALVVCFGEVMPTSAAAVLVKGDPPVIDVPVLVADPAVPWNQLLHLLEAVVTGSTDAATDLFAFANAVAAAVGGAVAIEDRDRRVLAYSSLDHAIDDARRQGILGRAVPHFGRNDKVYRSVYRSNEVVRVPADGEVLARLAVAVRSGPEVLGSIWVIDDGALDVTALAAAGRLAALHLLRARSLMHAERRARGEILRGLLDGRSSPHLAGARLGVASSTPVTVIAFGIGTSGADEVSAEAIADLIHVQAAAIAPRTTVLVELATVYAAIPGDVTRAALRDLATTVLERATAVTAAPLSAAVGATVSSLAEAACSRADADSVLAIQPPAAVGLVEDRMAQLVLLELGRHLAATPRLRVGCVDRMLDADAREGTAYAETVLAYVASNGAVGEAARSIYVHPNTFRYRLQRARELFELDLDDPDSRLAIWLTLRAR